MHLVASHTMRIQILMHGVLRQLSGQDVVHLQVNDQACVQDALDALSIQAPAVKEEILRCACALGDSLVTRKHLIRDGDELALIPPVSGG